MRDAERFTVDDPRFSTAAVLGESMLSLDGPEHERHRSAFASHFRPAIVREEYEEMVSSCARHLTNAVAAAGSAELRTALAGPLAVESITRFIGLADVEPATMLDWYRNLSSAIVGVATGEEIPQAGHESLAQLYEGISSTVAEGSSGLLRTLEDEAILAADEITPATAVVMFGAIETSEGMTANALWHLLSHPQVLAEVAADRSLLSAVIEESLRLEPAAAVIDRYTTCDALLGDVVIPEREMVTISLLGANRDPNVFVDPDRFDIGRNNLSKHVTFVQGPHGCMGLHLARLETTAAIGAVLDLLPAISLNQEESQPPEGLIFRKPPAVTATWQPRS